MAELSIFTSPKRKRELADNPGRAASPLRLRMDLDQIPTMENPPDEAEGRISQEFQDMHINTAAPTQRLSFRGKLGPRLDAATLGHGLSDDMDASPAAPEPTSQPGSHQFPRGAHHYAPPQTPPLHPTSMSPYGTPRTISPLPSISDLAGAAAADPDAAHPSGPRLATPPPSTDTTPSRRNRSPPPAALNSDLVWTAGEITGHRPDDPNDDGYGINGIGFRPTSAVAQQRALRRRQQVAEWKTREAREARSRRAERRRSGFRGVLDREDDWQGSQRRVRFVEG